MDAGALQPQLADLHQLIASVSNPSTRAAQGVGRPHYEGQAQLLNGSESLLHGVYSNTSRNGLSNTLHCLLEQVSVLGLLDGPDRGAQDFDVVLLQDSHLCQLAGEVQPCLAADASDYAVRPLLLYDLRQDLGHQGLDVDLLCHVRIGHYGSRVGVDQDHLYPFLPEGLACLGP
ncbi:Uncharacterised protein [uncultured archaeon]|nr:Uncharacterised protein [uncultured archaeon]